MLIIKSNDSVHSVQVKQTRNDQIDVLFNGVQVAYFFEPTEGEQVQLTIVQNMVTVQQLKLNLF